MPVPFRNVRIVTPDRCVFTAFSGAEDLRLWWQVQAGDGCPPPECTRVAEAWATTEPTCDEPSGGGAHAGLLGIVGIAILALRRWA